MNREISVIPNDPPGKRIQQEVFNARKYVSVSGRPLYELNANKDTIAAARARGVSMETVPHGFHDSRSESDKPKNADAMIDISKLGDDFTNTLAWMNLLFFADDNTSGRTINKLHDMAVTARWLSSYLVLRAQEPNIKPDQIPNSLAALFKASLGIIIVTTLLKEMNLGEKIMSPIEIYEKANSRISMEDGTISDPLLIGEDEVCAASDNLIVSTLDILMRGSAGDPEKSELARFIDPRDPDDFDEFAKVRTFAGLSEDYEQLAKKLKKLREIEQPDEETINQIKLFPRRELALQRPWNKALGRNPDIIK